MRATILTIAVCALLASASTASAADAATRWGLKEGKAELQSAGPLAFGPDGILIVGDTKAATVYAIDTKDAKGDPAKVKHNISGLNTKVSQAFDSSSGVKINDLAVNPASGNIYLSVTAGERAALLRVGADGSIKRVPLNKVAHAKLQLPNAPEDKTVRGRRGSYNLRDTSITDLAYTEGKVLVSGTGKMARGERRAPSFVREVPFPFTTGDVGANIQIYHAAHGKNETTAAVRTFVPFTINGEPSLLAGFTCTPLVKFPVKALSNKKAVGTTVAELGNRNTPLDMIVYKKDGATFLLMANDRRGVMKISTEGIDRKDGLTTRVGGGGTAGQKFETIEELTGVVQLDRLNDSHAVILVKSEGGLDLKTIALP